MPEMSTWVNSPLTEMCNTAMLLLREEADIVDIAMAERDSSGYQRNLRLIVHANVVEGERFNDEATSEPDKEDQSQYSDV